MPPLSTSISNNCNSLYQTKMFLFVNECFLFTKNVSILKHNNALNVVCSKGEGCKNSESDSYLFPCQGNSQEEVQLAAEIFSFRPAGGIFILLTLSLTSTLFKTHTIFFFICHNEFWFFFYKWTYMDKFLQQKVKVRVKTSHFWGRNRKKISPCILTFGAP